MALDGSSVNGEFAVCKPAPALRERIVGSSSKLMSSSIILRCLSSARRLAASTKDSASELFEALNIGAEGNSAMGVNAARGSEDGDTATNAPNSESAEEGAAPAAVSFPKITVSGFPFAPDAPGMEIEFVGLL